MVTNMPALYAPIRNRSIDDRERSQSESAAHPRPRRSIWRHSGTWETPDPASRCTRCSTLRVFWPSGPRKVESNSLSWCAAVCARGFGVAVVFGVVRMCERYKCQRPGACKKRRGVGYWGSLAV